MREFQEQNIAPKTVIDAPSVSELRDEPSVSVVGANSFNKKEKICGIYKITSPSGKIYIGASISCLSRRYSYKSKHCKDQPKLYNSINKYGWENHLFEIIHKCSIKDLDNLEIYYAKLYNVYDSNKGLNLKECGKNHGKHLEETKIKIRKNHWTNSPNSEKIREKIRIANTGQVVTEETKQKLRIKNLGKKHSEETKMILRNKSTGRKLSDEAKLKISISHIGNKNALGWIPSKEIRKKIGEANKGEKNGMYGVKQSAETIKKRIAKLKGKKRTPEQIERIKQGRIENGGWSVSEEARKKMSESHKGKKRIPMTNDQKIKISKANKGKPAWNKGKIGVYSDDQIQRMSDSKKGNKNAMFGKKLTKKQRDAFIKKGKDHWLFGKKMSKDYRKKLSDSHKEYWRKKHLAQNLV